MYQVVIIWKGNRQEEFQVSTQEEAWSATCKALEDGALKADFYEVKA